MCRIQFLLVFVALSVGMVQSWDIAMSAGDDTLSFYTNEILTSTTSIKSRNLTILAYDEVHNMMLYVDNQTNNNIICGYDLASAENKCFTEGYGRNIHGLAFDPVTKLVFFTDTNDRSVNWISLKPGFKNNGNGHLLIKMTDGIPRDIVVDSCKGYVYWLNTDLVRPTLERARLDGTEREVFETLTSIPLNANKLEPNSLAIDQQSHAIYWMEPVNCTFYELFSSALNKKHKKAVIGYGPNFNSMFTHPLNTLTLSKNSVIFMGFGKETNPIEKYSNSFDKIERKTTYEEKRPVHIVANYKIKDQIQGIQDCEALSKVEVATEHDKPFCVHGTKVHGQPACNCTPGYTGERCDVSVCEKHCLHGNCSFNDEGQPECKCEAGYSGQRCEVNECQGYCLNDGQCYLNEENGPSCQCVEGYEGTRCEADGSDTLTVLVNYRNKSSTCSCQHSSQTFKPIKS